MGEQHRLGNRERREAAIGIEQTPISFGQKSPLRRFYLVTLRHNESLSSQASNCGNAALNFREVFTSALRPIRAAYRAPRKPGVFRNRLRMRGERSRGTRHPNRPALRRHVVRVDLVVGVLHVHEDGADEVEAALHLYAPPTIECGRGGGIRTRKGLRPPASETGASACSATPRWHQVEESNPNIRF